MGKIVQLAMGEPFLPNIVPNTPKKCDSNGMLSAHNSCYLMKLTLHPNTDKANTNRDFDLMEAGNDTWSRLTTHDFWDSFCPSDHVVQIYNDDHTFLDQLEGFVTSGIAANDCVIVIATDEHQHALEERLRYKGHNIFDLKLRDQYIPLNARETLGEFIINNWPDEVLFRHMLNRFLGRARSHNRNVRAFGEMVALLWSQGNVAATVQLENLWNKICQDEGLSLFCAYPDSSLNQPALESILHICGSHSKMIKVDGAHQGILCKELEADKNRRRTVS